ncbi:MAG: hypothetical protein PHX25_01350 [Candidatus Pacebacteria bacterium]|nr:hypothetical protein [Candidatus Paceibacterota bacterium]
MKNKLILISIIVLGIILGGFYLISKTGNQSDDVNNTNEIATTTEQTLLDTSDWETCRNDEYGYEFKYPKDWYIYERMVGTQVEVESSSVTEIDSCQGKLLVLSQKLSVRGGWYPPTINISIVDFDSPETFLKYINTEIIPVKILEKYTKNNIEITRYERQGRQQAVLNYDNKMINLQIDTREYYEENDFINSVLSTFKSIN